MTRPSVKCLHTPPTNRAAIRDEVAKRITGLDRRVVGCGRCVTKRIKPNTKDEFGTISDSSKSGHRELSDAHAKTLG